MAELFGFKSHEIYFLVGLLCIPLLIAQTWFLCLVSFAVVLYVAYYIYQKLYSKPIEVKGQGVFITGCDTGFGFGLAKHLDSLGFTVFAGCLFEKGEGAQTLRASNTGRMHVLHLDVTNDESVTVAYQYVKKVTSETKCGLWGVVNNAGIQVYGEVAFCTIDIYKKVAEVNLFGLVRVTKTFLPLIRQTKGRIINVTSVMGRIGLPFHAAYGITKYGGETFSDVLRLEIRKFGIKVIVVEPGNFAGITGILSQENLKRIKVQHDAMWDAADSETQEIYGREYYDTLYKTVEGCRPYGYPTLEPTNDVFVDALTNKNPQFRYLIDGSRGWIDKYCVLARLHSYLPTYIMDILRERYLLNHMPPIKSNQQ